MQIDRFLADLIPGAKRIVAKDQQPAVYRQLLIMLCAGPTRGLYGRRAIVVADNQMLLAMKRRQ